MNDRLRAVAAEREVSANSIINHAVKDFLDRLIPLSDDVKCGRPEAPAPMPTLNHESWVNVYPDGMLGDPRRSREMAIAWDASDSVGTVQLAPVLSSWQPAERGKP